MTRDRMTRVNAQTARVRFKNVQGLVLLGSLLALVLVFTNVLPLLRLLQRAVSPEALSWLVSSSLAHTALWNSLQVSSTVALFATVLALALVLLLEKTNLPGRKVLKLLLFVPLVVPPQILTIAWLNWAGPVGHLQQLVKRFLDSNTPLWNLYSQGGIILLLVVFTLPVAYLTLAPGLSRIPKSLEEAAGLDGASLTDVWLRILFPLLLPGVLAAFVLAFLAALGNFGIQALLGIPAQFVTLPTLIYQRVASFASGGFDHAAALTLVLSLPALLALSVQYLVLKRRDTQLETLLEPPLRYELGIWRWVGAVTLWLLVAGVVTLGPFVSMVLTALTKAYGLPPTFSNLTLTHFAFVLGELDSFRRALANSFMLALVAALVTATLALLIGYVLLKLHGRFALPLQLFIDLPYALPGLVFALALILVWLRSPVPLYGTLSLLLLAYVGHYLAFALQSVSAAWRQLDKGLEEASRVDGASLFARMRFVFLPLLLPSLVAAALLVFLNAFTELSLSALLAGSRSETLGWLVFGLEQAGSSNQAAAVSTVLVLVLAVLALVLTSVQRIIQVSRQTP